MPRGHPGQVKETTKNLGNHGNLPGPGPGRPKGVPNKVNRDLKEAYLPISPAARKGWLAISRSRLS
jgi:hypothetical protein